MHNNCTASCAATRKQRQGFQQSAQLTHIFYKYFYKKKMAAALSVRPQIRTLKESYENAVQCMQIFKSPAPTGLEPHSYVCAMLSLLCKKISLLFICY